MAYLYHNKGHYTVNGQRFFNKLEAILEAKKTGKWVEWDYHHAIFNRYDWTKPDDRSLAQLYLERAWQLRDAYDHLVLFFSGGVDSWNILKVFVDNKIRLDEIYIFGAFKAEENKYTDLGFDRDPGYYTREIQRAVPMVKRLVADLGIKVTVYDWTDDIMTGFDDLDWFWKTGTRFGPDTVPRIKFHKKFREHNDLLFKGRRVGFVYGVDKPRLLRDDNSVYFAFLDLMMTTGTVPTNDILGEDWEHDEYFYWTPNMPELTIKQSHLVVDWLKNLNQVELIKHMNNIASYHDEEYYRQVNLAIYPDWGPATWQIKKPSGPTYNELSKWFLDQDSKAKQRWESSLEEIQRICGEEWFNKGTIRHGLRGHLSPLYKISDY